MINLILMLINFGILLTAFIFPMFGQGGGAMYVPLFSFKGFDFYQAVAASQSLIVVSSFFAMLVYHRAKLISWKLFFLVEVPTILGAFIGGWSSEFIPSDFMRIIFVFLLFLSGFSILRPHILQDDSLYNDEFSFSAVFRSKFRLGLGIFAMFIAGVMAGLLGIGGGVIKVPVMILLLRIPVKIAVGTSGLMVGFTALSGLLGHGLVGHLNIKALCPYLILVAIASYLGAKIGASLDKDKYKKWLGILLIAMSFFYGLRLILAFR